MSVYSFERLDPSDAPEKGDSFGSFEEALQAVEASFRNGPVKDETERLARQDPRISFRRQECDGGVLITVFPEEVPKGRPLAAYKISVAPAGE